MAHKYGMPALERSGTLPWTIEAEAQAVEQAWRKDECNDAILHSGYLVYYVGNATQPLHTTKHYDGYAQDRGLHARLEGVADRSVDQVEQVARPQVHIGQTNSVWQSAIDELRHSNPLFPTIVDADRAARAESGAKRGDEFDRALMKRELPMIAQQVAEASSVLASLWLYEGKKAGSPVPAHDKIAHCATPRDRSNFCNIHQTDTIQIIWSAGTRIG
jgi:hypothetical protein